MKNELKKMWSGADGGGEVSEGPTKTTETCVSEGDLFPQDRYKH